MLQEMSRQRPLAGEIHHGEQIRIYEQDRRSGCEVSNARWSIAARLSFCSHSVTTAIFSPDPRVGRIDRANTFLHSN